MQNEVWRSFKRVWVHHTGMQLATLSVLAATFTVMVFVFCLSLNLKKILSFWGDTVQVSVYLKDDLTETQIESLKVEIEKMPEVAGTSFVSRKRASEVFKEQIASLAPDLLQDREFQDPFPASFQVGVKGGVHNQADLRAVENLANRLKVLDEVEDVSYGQSWVKNYASFVNAISASGWLIVAILLAGSLLVVGNSVRASISSRRDEIEILELVGATKTMIRRPYLVEGAILGLASAIIALIINFVLFKWQMQIVHSSLAFSRLSDQFSYLGWLWFFVVILTGTALGAFGAFLSVWQINDGWAASQRNEN